MQRKETDGVCGPQAKCGLRWAGRVLGALIVVAAPQANAAEDDGYDLVQSPPPAKVRAGQKATLSLSVAPRTGYRLLAEGPVHLKVTATSARPARPLYQREDAVDPRADVPRFEIQVVTEKHKGPVKVDAAATFYLCKDTRCRPVETSATWSFTTD
jgi:hypothetical protein